jgi:hypothetical protein
MTWAAAMRLGMAEGDALALAREAGQLRGHLNNYILSKWAQDSLVMILLEEIEDIANGKRETHFFGDMANKDARNAFRTRYFEIVRARDDGKVDLQSIDLSKAETRDLAMVIAKKFARPSAQIRNTPVVGLTPLDAARKALADARANAFGGLVIEHVLMEEAAQLAAGNANAMHFSMRANKPDRDKLRATGARLSERIRTMPSDEQDRVVEGLANEIRNPVKRPAASQ